MTADHINRLLDQYDSRLVIAFPTAGVVRKPQTSIPLLGEAEHLRWMISETRKLLEHSTLVRASRWLGFIEGSLVQLGLASLEDIMLLDVESFFPSS